MSLEPVLQDALNELTADLGCAAPEHVIRLPGGRNNRVFRVDAGEQRFLLKHYYSDPEDPRDRLAADFGFSRFLWAHGVTNITRPLAAHPLFGIALYDFVDGRRLQTAEISPARVDEALRFVAAINAHRGVPDAARLPFAAEACFSILDHVQTVDARVRRLRRAPDLSSEAAALISGRLVPLWEALQRRIAAYATDTILPAAQRCLSPSDFGFHNALLPEDGGLVFHDFEYAGWDDPAKLVCDFFCQVEVPVSTAFLDAFIATVLDTLALPDHHRQRIITLLPVYRLKWCTIVLNDFLPEAQRRRRFAGQADGEAEHQQAQLQRASTLLDQIEQNLDAVR